MKMDDEKTMRRLGELRDSLPPAAMVADGKAYVDFLAKQESVSGGAMGAVGYCFTGAMALRFAASQPDKIAAAASFHGGRLYTDDPTSPHTLLPRVKARLYFGHAIEDRSMPKEAIEKFELELAKWGGKYESDTYAGAHHGWTVPDSPSYNQPQAERAFAKLTNFWRDTEVNASQAAAPAQPAVNRRLESAPGLWHTLRMLPRPLRMTSMA